MTPARNEAYHALDSERDYQDAAMADESKPNMHALTPGEMILAMEVCLEHAKVSWYNTGHPHTGMLNYVRKVGGLAVQCMEQYGAPQREGFER